MTTAMFERAGRVADQVREEARQLDPVKVLLTIVMVVPFLAGWLIGKAFTAVWTAFSWVWVAAKLGFRSARGKDGSGKDGTG